MRPLPGRAWLSPPACFNLATHLHFSSVNENLEVIMSVRRITIMTTVLALAALFGVFQATNGQHSARAATPRDAANLSTQPQQSYADTVDRVAPAVVTIRSARRVRAPQQFPFMNDPFFQMFGGRNGNRQGNNRSEVEHSLG